MRKLMLVVFLLVLNLSLFAQTESKLTWHTDIAKAHQISAASKKPIFAFFTGSDWCGWCKKLQRDVFSKQEFITWAESNVVLLELDFPRNKALPEAMVQQNYSLQQFFKVQGYPTIWMFNMSKDEKNNQFLISALGSLGYPSGAEPGKEQVKFLETANAVLVKK